MIHDNAYKHWNKYYAKTPQLRFDLPHFQCPIDYLTYGNAQYLHRFLILNFSPIFCAMIKDHPNLEDGAAARNTHKSVSAKAEHIISRVFTASFWPYDGWNVWTDWFERPHARIFRDILRAKWPVDETATSDVGMLNIFSHKIMFVTHPHRHIHTYMHTQKMAFYFSNNRLCLCVFFCLLGILKND